MEDKKKPIYKKWWFWLIIVIVIIGIAGSSSVFQPKTTLISDADGNSTSGTQNNNTSKEYSVGEVYQDNSLAIKFVSLDDNFKGYNQYVDIKNGYKVIKAEFEFENIGNSDVLADAYRFNCYADGYDCEDFWSTDDSGFSSNLSAGKKAKGNVYFQVPTDASNIVLEYETNIWTNSKVTFKVK